MRIAFVSHAYPRWDHDISGNFIARLAEAIAQRGHDVTAFVPADRGTGGVEDVRGVRVKRLRYAPAALERLAHRGTAMREAATPWGAVAFWNLIAKLTSAIVAGQFDAVHAHWWIPAGIAATRAARRGAPPPIITSHGTDLRLAGRIPGSTAMARRVLARARAVTTVSSFLAARAARITQVDPKTIPVIPMPAALERVPTTPPERGRGIVVVSRLTRQKRIDLVLAAAAELRARGHGQRVRIVGDGPERGHLERVAQKFDLHDVEFTGMVPGRDVPDFLSRSAVAAFPAHGEGFGLAAAEAFMCGVPVVAASDGGGVLDVVPDNGPGRRASPDSVTAWADALDALLASSEAPALAWAEGQRWRGLLAPSYVAQRFEELYGG